MTKTLHITASIFKDKRFQSAAGVSFLGLLAVVLITPALRHGSQLGPYSALANVGLTSQAGVTSYGVNWTDMITEIIPWSNEAWRQVHQGHIPLWSPYSGLGFPLAFNWVSSVFSLPSLTAYLFPLRYFLEVSILTTLFVAGTGVFVLGRVMKLGLIASVFMGSVFELSGALISQIGMPQAGAASWTGWLFASVFIVIRGKNHRFRNSAFLGAIISLSIYAGHPETTIVVFLTLSIFTLFLVLHDKSCRKEDHQFLRPITDLSISAALGISLTAPLILPGIPVIMNSALQAFNAKSGAHVVPLRHIPYAIMQGFDGVPTSSGIAFKPEAYPQVAFYLGIIAVILAALGIILDHKRKEVIIFSVIAIICLVVVFLPLSSAVLNSIPLLQTVYWQRIFVPLTLCIAVLSGFGCNMVVKNARQSDVAKWLGGLFIFSGISLFVLVVSTKGDLPESLQNIRNSSYWGPILGVSLGLVVALFLLLSRHSWNSKPMTLLGGSAGPLAGLVLLLVSTGFLLTSGAPTVSATNHYVEPTKQVALLERLVGSSRVGSLGYCLDKGIPSEYNSSFNISQLNAYSSTIPAAYFYNAWETGTLPRSWRSALSSDFVWYCPQITTMQAARLYGVGFVLTPANAFGPPGSSFVSNVGNENLYRIPSSGEATLVATKNRSFIPNSDTQGEVLEVTHPDESSMNLSTSSLNPGYLRIRLTNTPGWVATMDGKPLQLIPFDKMMLQAFIPPGQHRVSLLYWPRSFTLGLWIAGLTALSILAFSIALLQRRKHLGLVAVTDSSIL